MYYPDGSDKDTPLLGVMSYRNVEWDKMISEDELTRRSRDTSVVHTLVVRKSKKKSSALFDWLVNENSDESRSKKIGISERSASSKGKGGASRIDAAGAVTRTDSG
mmetsp:Transcript_20095/g.49331  ORF Transcript_20095/g.49331 Transcript_20095/m.49331 type:complete len:106 (-) Transcript_20095:5-322(-)